MLWDLNEDKHLYTLTGGEVINALVFSPNRYWLCAATGQAVKIWVSVWVRWCVFVRCALLCRVREVCVCCVGGVLCCVGCVRCVCVCVFVDECVLCCVFMLCVVFALIAVSGTY